MDETIREFGSSIWIQKQQDPLRVGTPDIYAMTNGVFIPIECKKIEKETGNSILAHEFKKTQIRRLKDLLKVGAYPIGLIFNELRNEKRYILPLAIRQDGNLSLNEYLTLPLFDWMEFQHVATEAYISRFKR